MCKLRWIITVITTQQFTGLEPPSTVEAKCLQLYINPDCMARHVDLGIAGFQAI